MAHSKPQRCLHIQLPECFKGGAIAHSPLTVSKAENPSPFCDTEHFLEESGPRCYRNDELYVAGIHQIKRFIRKVHGLHHIADLESDVVESASTRLDIGILDHAFTDIDASHLHVWIGLGKFQ